MTSIYDAWVARYTAEAEEVASADGQQALVDFLNRKTSAREAAERYTCDITPAKDMELICLWTLLYEAAKKFPQDHERLIELLLAISQLPPVKEHGETVKVYGEEYWSGLPMLASELRDHWDGQVDYIRHHSDPILHREFIHLTAFNARLWASGIFELSKWGIMTFSIVLERNYDGKPQLLDTYIAAASQYVLLAGRKLYQCDKDALFHGPALQEFEEHSQITRWDFWKSRLAAVKVDDGVWENTQATAGQTLDCMEKLEKEG